MCSAPNVYMFVYILIGTHMVPLTLESAAKYGIYSQYLDTLYLYIWLNILFKLLYTREARSSSILLLYLVLSFWLSMVYNYNINGKEFGLSPEPNTHVHCLKAFSTTRKLIYPLSEQKTLCAFCSGVAWEWCHHTPCAFWSGVAWAWRRLLSYII